MLDDVCAHTEVCVFVSVCVWFIFGKKRVMRKWETKKWKKETSNSKQNALNDT